MPLPNRPSVRYGKVLPSMRQILAEVTEVFLNTVALYLDWSQPPDAVRFRSF